MARRTQRDTKPESTTVGGKISVTVNSGEGLGDPVEEHLEVHKFEVEPAYVTVGAGVTKNLGDYESLRVDVRVSIPCYRENLESVYGLVSEFVAAKLQEEVDAYTGGGE